MSARTVLAAALALGLALFGPGPARAAAAAKGAVAPAVAAAERTATLLEGEDDGALRVYPPTFTPPSTAEVEARNGLVATARALDTHLARSPRDARALVARGRLMRQQAIAASFEAVSRGESSAGADPHGPILEEFDRALAIDSTRSDALYGKALTLATKFLGLETPERFEEALPLARRAHQAAPDDPKRIALLERCLLAVGEDLEAERVRDPSAGKDGAPSPVARILERRAQVPAPPGMVAMPRLRETLGLLVQKKPGDRTAAAAWARARMFQGVSVALDTLLAFYATRLPGLVWTEQRLEPEPQMMSFVTRFAMAALQWKDGSGWVPVDLEGFDPFQRDDVLLLTLVESDYERMRSLVPPETLAAMPDSLRDSPLPSATVLMLLDRVGLGR